MSSKLKLILGFLAAILLVAGGGYYWHLGTPEYSIGQLQKAAQNNDPELAMKYIDEEKLFENIWLDLKEKMQKEVEKTSSDWGKLGANLGISMIENMKPTFEEKVKKGIKTSFKKNKKEDQEDLIGEFSSKDFEIKQKENRAEVELNNKTLIFKERSNERKWVLVDIKGLLDSENGLSDLDSKNLSNNTSDNTSDLQETKKQNNELKIPTMGFVK